MNRAIIHLFLFTCLLLTASCRDEHLIVYPEEIDTGKEAVSSDVTGMYVLNEGNMGSNKCTLDFLDLSGNTPTVHYWRNIYAERNPSVVKELGDVGNDIKIYGSRMWIVINCSDKVEVVRANNCERIGQVNIPNCRNVVFDGSYAYISSYVGPVDVDVEAQIGMVYKVDTLSLEIVKTVNVGYQPEELAVIDGKLYVANSGGYIAPVYDHTVSVIDLNTFTEERKIDVGVNLHRCRADKYGQLWVTSRGNYINKEACLYWLEEKDTRSKEMVVGGTLPCAVSDMCIVGDSLYFFGSEWSEVLQRNTVSYGIINVRTHEVVTHQLSNTPEIASIRMPYGIIVNPKERDFYLMDAKNYVSSGELLHFLADGTFDWRVTTGDIPAHAVFLTSAASGGGSTPITPDNRNLIKAVDEYVPAPGQFVNQLPEATADDTPATMVQKCTERLANGTGSLVTLGGWGGYVTFHFHHPVVNVAGQRDFTIWGNAFEGNAEPGIVMVSIDTNNNGLPDDTWYELKGSEYSHTIHDYSVTYTYQSMHDTPWTDNQWQNGVIPRNTYHTQEYFPLWLTSQGSLTFNGGRLPDNATYADGSYTLHAFGYGYADNLPNTNIEGCSMDLGWAVDANGNSVSLSHADFVRISNGTNQVCGTLGETSTEVMGAEDLHPDMTTESNSPLYY